jgi:hypothetical protein
MTPPPRSEQIHYELGEMSQATGKLLCDNLECSDSDEDSENSDDLTPLITLSAERIRLQQQAQDEGAVVARAISSSLSSVPMDLDRGNNVRVVPATDNETPQGQDGLSNLSYNSNTDMASVLHSNTQTAVPTVEKTMPLPRIQPAATYSQLMPPPMLPGERTERIHQQQQSSLRASPRIPGEDVSTTILSMPLRHLAANQQYDSFPNYSASGRRA